MSKGIRRNAIKRYSRSGLELTSRHKAHVLLCDLSVNETPAATLGGESLLPSAAKKPNIQNRMPGTRAARPSDGST